MKMDFQINQQLAWQENAACAGSDPDLFDPPATTGRTSYRVPAQTKAICMQCSVMHDCLEYAIQNPDMQGVWGGTSERERAALRLQRSVS